MALIICFSLSILADCSENVKQKATDFGSVQGGGTACSLSYPKTGKQLVPQNLAQYSFWCSAADSTEQQRTAISYKFISVPQGGEKDGRGEAEASPRARLRIWKVSGIVVFLLWFGDIRGRLILAICLFRWYNHALSLAEGGGQSFRCFFRMRATSSMSMGFATWAFMP